MGAWAFFSSSPWSGWQFLWPAGCCRRSPERVQLSEILPPNLPPELLIASFPPQHAEIKRHASGVPPGRLQKKPRKGIDPIGHLPGHVELRIEGRSNFVVKRLNRRPSSERRHHRVRRHLTASDRIINSFAEKGIDQRPGISNQKNPAFRERRRRVTINR